MPTTAGGVIDQGQIASSRTFTTEDIEPSSVSLSAIPAGDRRPVAVLVKWRQQLGKRRLIRANDHRQIRGLSSCWPV